MRNQNFPVGWLGLRRLLGSEFTNNHRHLLLYYTRLFGGNLSVLVAKMFAMVKPYIGYDTQQRSYDVCGIEPATESALYYCYIYLLFLEILESQSSCYFKK